MLQQSRIRGDRWAPSEVLASLWQTVHVDGPAVVMCHSGHRASSTFFIYAPMLSEEYCGAMHNPMMRSGKASSNSA